MVLSTRRGEETMAKIFRVILPVGNIERAAAFYRGVFNVGGERVSRGRHYFELDGTVLALYDPVADGDRVEEGWRFHRNQYLYLAVDHLGEFLQRFEASGGTLQEPIEEMPWGERLFYGTDPFNNPLAFVDQDTLFFGGRFIE
jgi:predicted enzyme related to lactoylglutathione lyase